MEILQNILLGIVSITTIISCTEEPTITPFRGKVKYETISVTSKLPGRIEKIYVSEGQEVKKGDTLAYLDTPEVGAKLTQANGAIKAAKGQLEMAYNGATEDQIHQIDGQLKAGKAQLEFAKESYKRMQAMYQDSLITQQQFDEITMKLEMAQAQVDGIEAKRKEVVTGTRKEQIDQAKGQLDRALGARDEVATASSEKYIIAPADMSIETISLKEGELLTPGYTLFNGYEKSSVYFRFTVSESKIYDFQIGQSLVIINPYTEEEIQAKISTIKQLAKYADITSTSPLYHLSESIYELKVVPVSDDNEPLHYMNATMLIKQ